MPLRYPSRARRPRRAPPLATRLTYPLSLFLFQPSLSAGRAYAFEGSKVCDWPGVVKVSANALSGVIAFGSGTALQSFSAAYPKGLWYGNVELSQVSHLSEGVPLPAGGRLARLRARHHAGVAVPLIVGFGSHDGFDIMPA